MLVGVTPTPFDTFGIQPAFARGGGNSGGGNSGDSHGNSGGSHGNSGGSHGNSGGNSGSGGGGSGNSNAKSGGSNSHAGTAPGQNKSSGNTATSNANAPVKANAVTTPSTLNGNSGKEKKLHALLGGLNSAGRSVTALLNSNDPRMVALVQYATDLANTQYSLEQAVTVANAALADAVAAQTMAQSTYDAALTAFNTAVTDSVLTSYDGKYAYTDPASTTYDALAAHLTDLGTVDTSSMDATTFAYSDEVTALTTLVKGPEASTLQTATTDLAAANGDVTNATDNLTAAQSNYNTAASTNFQVDGTSTSLDSLNAAILAAANPNFEWKYGTPTDEMVQWVGDALGVGPSTGVVDTIYNDLATTSP